MAITQLKRVMSNNISNDIINSIVKDAGKYDFGEYLLEIGVFSTDTSRKEVIVSVGLTNAELMFIHENGSPLRNIPQRPVLQITLDWAKDNIIPKTLQKCSDGILLKGWSTEEVEKELNKMAIRIQNYARGVIRYSDSNGLLAPNSPRVAKRKKGNHPLFDTGQLSRSIRCKIVKIK